MADEDDDLGEDAVPDADLDEEDLDEEDLDEEDLVVVDLEDDLVGDDVTDDAALVEIPVADLEDDVDIAVDRVEEVDAPPPPPRAPAGDDEDDDDEVVDPDDVEEDLDTILRDRIAAGTDADEEDEEAGPEDRNGTGDRVSPRKPEEVSCPECFLLVRRSQFSTRRADCPGGLDGADCPMMRVFVGTG